ncbi:Ohr family peroxiredoxin [Actinocorallia aurea]
MSDPPGDAGFRTLHTARVAVGGGDLAHGRASGEARSADGTLAFDLRMPAELGGDAAGPNPEQLLAAAFAASLHAELALLARGHLLDPAPITVEATVAVGPDPSAPGHVLRASVEVAWPGVARDAAARLLARAVARCPYAKLAEHGIPTTVVLAPDAP